MVVRRMAPRLTHEERRAIVLMGRTMTQRSICAATGRPKATVSRVLQAYYREGRICDAPRASVGRKTTATEDQLIVGAASENPFLSAREIRDEVGVGNVSVSTIRRRLHEAGLKNQIAVQKTLLEQRHRDQRMEFASVVESWTPENWRAVIFTDEASFCTRWDQERKVWRPERSR